MTDKEEIEKAATTAAMAALDPLTLAKQNAQLRSSVKGQHLILFALMRRLGDGPITITPDEWRPVEEKKFEMKVEVTDRSETTLRVVPVKNLAIRPKKGKR